MCSVYGNEQVYDYNQIIDWMILIAILASSQILRTKNGVWDNKRQEVILNDCGNEVSVDGDENIKLE
jgi:hypothetical protein